MCVLRPVAKHVIRVVQPLTAAVTSYIKVAVTLAPFYGNRKYSIIVQIVYIQTQKPLSCRTHESGVMVITVAASTTAVMIVRHYHQQEL